MWVLTRPLISPAARFLQSARQCLLPVMLWMASLMALLTTQGNAISIHRYCSATKRNPTVVSLQLKLPNLRECMPACEIQKEGSFIQAIFQGVRKEIMAGKRGLLAMDLGKL